MAAVQAKAELAAMTHSQSKIKRKKGILCVPTKVLANEQAKVAGKHRIRAIAIHEDSLAAAKCMKPPRNLFQEVVQDKWDLIVVSPEMMQETAFTHCLLNKRVISSIGWVFIDEPHLAINWSFQNKLRSRIGDSAVAWAAYTATIAPGAPLQKLKKVLSFTDGHYKSIRMPVDRPEIKYMPEFFRHPHTGMDIPDIGWLIPSKAKAAADIP
ncbi:hypothetical protein FRC04_003502 [Tulasnella sp. 424]|nr:hypothetical protein FRC04_003502 [Tulasnella sp. 424]KAG8962923.1 hypothetical protein FRC05_004977 [Tulasnella sp. 425]